MLAPHDERARGRYG